MQKQGYVKHCSIVISRLLSWSLQDSLEIDKKLHYIYHHVSYIMHIKYKIIEKSVLQPFNWVTDQTQLLHLHQDILYLLYFKTKIRVKVQMILRIKERTMCISNLKSNIFFQMSFIRSNSNNHSFNRVGTISNIASGNPIVNLYFACSQKHEI